jgi:hypothetical protein
VTFSYLRDQKPAKNGIEDISTVFWVNSLMFMVHFLFYFCIDVLWCLNGRNQTDISSAASILIGMQACQFHLCNASRVLLAFALVSFDDLGLCTIDMEYCEL